MVRLLALLVLAGCAGASPPDGPPLPEGRVALRLTDVDGERFTLASLRGRPVLVTVITTWSDFALLEVPRFKALLEREPSLQIVTIALDEDANMVRMFRDTFEIPYRVATVEDPERFTSTGGPFGRITIIPTSILLDTEGKIVARMDGMWAPKVLEAAVQKVAATDARN